MKLTVKPHKIYDRKFTNWETEVRNKWVYDDFVSDEAYCKEWISVTCLAYHEPTDSVYIGIGRNCYGGSIARLGKLKVSVMRKSVTDMMESFIGL